MNEIDSQATLAGIQEALRDNASNIGFIVRELRLVTEKIEKISSRITLFEETVFQKQVDQRRDLTDVCIARHKDIDIRLERLEHAEIAFDERINDMGEDTKKYLIKNLEQQVNGYKEREEKNKLNISYWKRYSITVIVGIMTIFLSAYITYKMNAISQQVQIQLQQIKK